MKVYEVDVQATVYVVAESRERAEHEAVRLMTDGSCPVASAEEVTAIERAHPDWIDALPFEGDGHHTVREYLTGKVKP